MKRIKYKPNILLYFFLVIIMFVSSAAADVHPAYSTIRGRIVDAKTGVPLPGANVFIEHTTIGAAADMNGNYIIRRIPPGEVHLVATMMGYKRDHQYINLEPDEMLVMNFRLESSIVEMGAVVVTGTSTPHLVQDMPVRTEVIPRRAIEQKHASNLAEALSFHTGIMVENNCNNCNFTSVRILGMEGKYTQILIDGDPVIGSLSGVYGLEHFPEEMVDQIEIVKGGGSSLYGGGAVAGVVNMITRRPMLNQIRIKYQNNFLNGSTDKRVGAVAEHVTEKGTSGAYVFGSYRERNPYDRNDDGFSELAELLHESMGFKWFYQPFDNAELQTSFHRIHEERRGGNKFHLPVHAADIAEWVEHWRSGGTVRWEHRPGKRFDYRVFYSFSDEKRKSYYGGLGGDTDEDRLEALRFYGRTENPLHITGFQSNYRLGGHLLTAGMQYSHDKIKDETTAETVYHLDDVYTNTGIFIQDNMHFGRDDDLEVVVGARFDNHSELADWVISPRINAKMNIGRDMTLRASYTTGFKAPQTYDEDLHLGGIGGNQRIIRNDPNLKAENSSSFFAGFEYLGFIKNNVAAMFSITGFYTRLSDSFAERFLYQQGAAERWERYNSDGAYFRGVEAEIGIRPSDRFEIRTGLTYKQSKYDEPLEDFDTRNFLRSPNLTGNLRLSLTLSSAFSIYMHGAYIGRAYVPREVIAEGQDEPDMRLVKSDDFYVADLGMTYQIPLQNGLHVKCHLGVKNILDAYQKDLDSGPDRDPGYFYGPSLPRTLFFSFEMSF